MLSGEVLNALTKLCFLAPPFDATADSIQEIINGNDKHESPSPIEAASIEARRLVFLLLADTHLSPFLYDIHKNSKKAVEPSIETEQASTLHLSQLSKALHDLLVNQGHDISIKIFLKICLSATPKLVPHFFKGLQLFDPKPTYRSLSGLTFVESVIREAPILTRHTNSISVEEVTSTIVPPCVTKSLLGKVIQSPSALLVSSGLKVIISLLRRADDSIFSLLTTGTDTASNNDDGAPEQLKSSLSHAVMRHLPDASLLLSIPSRFDPFDNQEETSSPNGVVVLQLCEVLQCLLTLDISWLTNIKFDWVKLLPNDKDEDRLFTNAEPILQHRILQTLLVISRLSEAPFSSKMLPSVLSILVSAKVPEVYTSARKLAILLMKREIFDSSSESCEVRQCHEYESSLWIDGISIDLIQELTSMIEESKQQRVQHKIMISQAWSSASMGYTMPSLGVSSFLLSSTFQMLRNDEVLSDKMAMLVLQIVFKILLFQRDPKPFAAIIFYCNDTFPMDGHNCTLRNIAGGILGSLGRDDKPFLIKTNESIKYLASEIFHPDSMINCIARVVNSTAENKDIARIIESIPHADTIALRQCLTMIKYSKGEQNEELNSLIRKILVDIVENGDHISENISMLLPMFKTSSNNTDEMESNLILLLAAARSKRPELEVKSMIECDETTTEEPRLISELLRCSLISGKFEASFINGICNYCLRAFQSVDTDTSLKDFLLTILLYTLPSKDGVGPSPGALFDLWAAIAGDLSNKTQVECCFRLEDCLVSTFNSIDGQGCWAVYQRICDLTPEVFVDLWVKTMLKRDNPGDFGRSILQSVIEYDCSEFSCLSSLFTANGTRIATLWNSGFLDDVAAAFVLQICKQKDSKAIMDNKPFKDAAVNIGLRFLALLANEQESATPRGILYTMILDVLCALCCNDHVPSDVQYGIIQVFIQVENQVFNQLDNGSLVLEIENERKLMLLLSVCTDPFQDNIELYHMTKAIVRCCKLLPKHIKKMVRTQDKDQAIVVESLIRIIFSMIEYAPKFDKETLTESSDLIDHCIIACLKYGMMESDNALSSIYGGCLKIVRLIISTRQVVLGSLTPSQIHAMTASHSSFQTALSSGSKSSSSKSDNIVLNSNRRSGSADNTTQQMELIKLLLCTLSLEPDLVKIEGETWTSVLMAYNASTDIADGLLRRLMFLYEQHHCCQDEVRLHVLFMIRPFKISVHFNEIIFSDHNERPPLGADSIYYKTYLG